MKFSFALAAVITFSQYDETAFFYPYNMVIVIAAAMYLGYTLNHNLIEMGFKPLNYINDMITLTTDDLIDPKIMQYKKLDDVSWSDFKYSSLSLDQIEKADAVIFIYKNDFKVLKFRNKIV